MYLDLFDELRLNKRLVKIAGFEVGFVQFSIHHTVQHGEIQNGLVAVMGKDFMSCLGIGFGHGAADEA